MPKRKAKPWEKDDDSSEDDNEDGEPEYRKKTVQSGGWGSKPGENRACMESATDAKELELLNAVLPEFDPKIMLPDSLSLVVGKRRFGKSTFARWCISQMAHMFPDGGYVFTTTKHNWFWQQHFPDTRVYDNFDWDVIKVILAKQLKKHEIRKLTGEKSLDYVLLVFDDCISERHEAKYAEDLLRLVFNGRHYKICIWLLAQDIKGFFPDVRANTDYAMCTYQIQERQTETVRKDFAGMFVHQDIFSEFLRKNTQDFQLLVIDQHLASSELASNEPGDGIFSVATADPEPPPFRVGDAQFWADSGCSWTDQLKIWDNLVKSDLTPEDIEKLAKEREKKSKKFEKENPQYVEEDYATAGWYAAQGGARKLLEEEALKNPSGWTTADKMVENFDNWYNNRAYIPTVNGYIEWQPGRNPANGRRSNRR